MFRKAWIGGLGLLGIELGVEPNSAWLQHCECLSESWTVSPNEGYDTPGKLGASLAGEADEDDAGGLRLRDVNEPAKVLVFGQEYSVVSVSEVDNVRVTGSRSQIRYGDYVVTLEPEGADDCKVAAFVRKESHSWTLGLFRSLENEGLLVSKRIGRIPQSRRDVEPGQAWIRIEQVLACCTLGELSEDQLNWNASAADDWFPRHYRRINLDTVRYGHGYTQTVVYWT